MSRKIFAETNNQLYQPYATAIASDEHFLRCLVYVDLNMVRAGFVQHPREWAHGGYREIQ